MKRLIILRGLPGSGKSTFAELFGGTICCADDYMVDADGDYFYEREKLKLCHSKCYYKFVKAVEAGDETIIIANTNVQKWEFAKYEDFAKKNDYKVFHIILENRHGSENVHGCPKEKLEDMKNRFEICL